MWKPTVRVTVVRSPSTPWRPPAPAGTITLSEAPGTKVVVGWKTRVVGELNVQDPATAGDKRGIGLSAARGSASRSVMRVSGLTLLAPGEGDAHVTISTAGLPVLVVGTGEAAAGAECGCTPTSVIVAAATAMATMTTAERSQVFL
jgi:hypothetical protein